MRNRRTTQRELNQAGRLQTVQGVSQPSLYDPALDTDSCGVGIVANTHGEPSRRVVELALTSLANVAHRGGLGANPTAADGSGVQTDLPKSLLQIWLNELQVNVDVDTVAVAMVFLPADRERFEECRQQLAAELSRVDLKLLGERTVPTNPGIFGEGSSSHVPEVWQFFIQAPDEPDNEAWERRLYLVSRRIARWAREHEQTDFSVSSLSSRVIVYKGLVKAQQLAQFYPDLADPRYEARFAIYHQRFSTNTSPRWELCQPFPMLAHNGEINTIRGNRNWMNARQPTLWHPHWGEEIGELFPITSHNESDSASLSNALQLLRHSGRDLMHAMSILVPPAWHGSTQLTAEEREFFDFQSCFSEPWDGPAAIAFTDGQLAAACLDRNGLRPARYKFTTDGLFILGSETGADRHPLSQTQSSGRLRPGEMIAVDINTGEVHFDQQIKARLAARQPYGQWLRDNRVRIAVGEEDLPVGAVAIGEVSRGGVPVDLDELTRRQIAAGLTVEDREIVIGAMVESGKEATVSMGLDTPLAILSRRPQLLSRYFKQRFAQVTNPPIDSVRERNVMSVAVGIGPERNLLDETPEHCKIIALDHPLLFEPEFVQLTQMSAFPARTIACCYNRTGALSLRSAIDTVCDAAEEAAEAGAQIIILSDRQFDSDHVAIPMLMAQGAVHHRLCAAGLRMKCSLIADTASVWDPHDYALLFGFGATAVCPYLALRTAASLETQPPDVALRNYRSAIEDGLRKIMAKMGISVLNSYQGAQTFETIGIDAEVIELCFRGTKTTIEGAGFDVFQRDYELLHAAAFESTTPTLANEGRYKPKKSGVRHLINGRVTKSLHQFVRDGDPSNYDAFTRSVQPDDPYAIRDLLTFNTSDKEETPLDGIEPVTAIQERFTTAAMSLGALSPEAHEAIAVAMNQIGGKSNSGEGGEDARRFIPDEFERDARSRIKQIASGRFGVTTEYLMSADEIEIKMAQGAKPGEGGQLQGFKVNEMIARLRYTGVGVPLISPPPHHDVYSIEDLAQLIYDLKCVNPRALVCVKLVAKTGIGNIAVGVAKANADVILISGHDGGTGASPLSSINHAGIPWELGLAETHQALVANGMRDRVIVRADGGIKTGRDVVIAALLGAEEFSFGTMALISLGCVYVKKCHLNNCPVGIATQDEKFRRRFHGEPEHLVRYLGAVAEDVRQHLSRLGNAHLHKIVGQTHLLAQRQYNNHPKANRVCLRPLLAQADWRSSPGTTLQPRPVSCFDDSLPPDIVERLSTGEHVTLERNVVNTDRNIGSRLAGRLSDARLDHRDDEENRLPPSQLTLRLTGSAGQSLGAFLIDGMTLHLQGEANDYVAKSMAGGTIVIRPPAGLQPNSQEHTLIGNTCLYGATGGRLFVAGQAAERFAIRNSGAHAVIEGCGDHGCEYMTRGTVVILGRTGQNLGAGMTGGTVFVLDAEDELTERLNHASVLPAPLTEDDQTELRQLIQQHAAETGSQLAERLLGNWPESLPGFRKVVPNGMNVPLSSRRDQPSVGLLEQTSAARVLGSLPAGD